MQGVHEQLEKKNQELLDLNRERSKKLSQITNLYNLLKARAMRSQLENAASDTVSQTINTFTTRAGPTVSNTHTTTTTHPQTPIFPISPEGVEQLHRYQRSGTGSSKRAGKKTPGGTAMLPPAARGNWKSPGCKR